MMKIINKSRQRVFYFCLLGVVLTQFYQNCGQLGEFQTLDMSSMELSSGTLNGTDLTHPSGKEVVLPTQKTLASNRMYVASLMREIFTSTATPVPNLEGLLNQWIYFRGGPYGLACNPYSSYTGSDCGGDISNSNLPYTTDDNTVRESFRLQFCENVLGYDAGVTALLEKVPRRGAAPNAESLRGIYELFYRGDGAPESVINSLLELDRSLAAKAEPPMERWRVAALQICESPGWQLQ
jgi:hypothetical protein